MSTESDLRAALTAAKEKLEEQDNYIKQIQEAAGQPAVVASVPKDDAVLVSVLGGGVVAMGVPAKLKAKLTPGQSLEVVGTMAGKVLKGLADWEMAGDILTVEGQIGREAVEVSGGAGGMSKVVNCDPKNQPQVGDRVTVDSSGYCVTRNLGKPKAKYATSAQTKVTWDDIGGLEVAKDALRDSIEGAAKHAELYRKFGYIPPRGVLLYGPPGNGKTMLAKAAATCAATVSGGAEGAYIYVKGPELLSMYVGETEARIRALFTQTREYSKEHGGRAVMFIDEAESILNRRGSRRSSDVDMTIVPQFLAEMDGLEDTGAFIILATNRPDALDPAVVRDGRIDRKVFVGRPDEPTSVEILVNGLKGKPTEAKPRVLAEVGVREIYSPHRKIEFSQAGKVGFLPMKRLVSGALLANVAQVATRNALGRALAGDATALIAPADMTAAVEMAWAGLKNLDHSDVFNEMTQ